jgi:hypothetical protein
MFKNFKIILMKILVFLNQFKNYLVDVISMISKREKENKENF